MAEARAAFTSTATARLSAASTAAVGTLRRLLNADSESVRLAAAPTILELGEKMRESVELEQRILALEAQQNETENSDPIAGKGATVAIAAKERERVISEYGHPISPMPCPDELFLAIADFCDEHGREYAVGHADAYETGVEARNRLTAAALQKYRSSWIARLAIGEFSGG